MSKIKGILFDEDEIEVQVDSDELPGMPPKEVKHLDRKVSSGIIEHHRVEEEEEDTIKEIKIPSYDEQEDIRLVKDTSKVALLDDDEMDRDFPVEHKEKEESPTRTLYDFDVNKRYGSRSNGYEENNYYKSVEEVRKEYNIGTPVKKHTEEIKDYRKMLNNDAESTKKPFTVTPVISPVYGILDKNYKAEDIEEKRELISKTNSGVKPRMFGPVSYNDEPLPMTKKSESPLKKDLVELNTTINELINDSVTSEDVQKAVSEKVDYYKEEEIEEDIPLSGDVPDDDEIIKTDNYDDYDATSIENEYIGNNNIEDAFDSTDEYKRINEVDDLKEPLDNTEPSIDIEQLIDKKDDDDDDQDLNNTIETDLFNLIDSMYKSDDKEEEE
ncbi:MAG: hypothetical protein J5982_02275 [Bacilli bacterium]|nr:hypothetical protein [Bacilli bacterium]